MFIAVEGIDGSGKTTTVHRLQLWLEKRTGKTVFVTQEPTEHPSGKLIRETLSRTDDSSPILHEKLALLFAADRLHHLEKDIWPALKEKKIVVTDRYLFSSIAYQSVSANYEWIKGLNRFAMLPDVMIYLSVSVKTALRRLSLYRTESDLYETGKYLTAITKNYDKIIEDFSPHLPIITLNAEVSPAEIDGEIEAKLGAHPLFSDFDS